jgi:hypothetical protein
MVGLFVGPVLMALLVAIWREWLLTTESDTAPESLRDSEQPAPTEAVIAAPMISPQKATAWSAAKVQKVPGS